jgi:hypothetical protein
MYGSNTCREQAETSYPKILFPQLFSHMRKLFFDDTRAGTFVGNDELRKFCLGMCFEQRMNMILIVIPF